MNHDELYEALDSSREKLLVLVDPLSDELLVKPGTIGNWSVRDLLFHLTTWEAELVTGLNSLDRNKKPGRLMDALADREAYNTARMAENPDRDLDRVFKDLQDVRFQLENWLEAFSARDLSDLKRYKWFEGEPLWKIIAETSFEHEASHLPALEQLLDQLADPPIGLNNIEVL